MNPINLWFVLILLMMVAAVGFRIWRRPLAPVRLEKIGSREVAEMVRDFLGTATDGAFGFPTGFFRIAILRHFYVGILAIAPEFGCVGLFAGILLAALLTPFLLYAALAELVLRFLLRSEIVAAIAPLPGKDAGSEVVFTLRGPSAMLIGRAVERAFHPPALPDRIRSLAGLPAQ